MKFFLVGGAIRDEMLGLPIKDKDYVVVGSSPKEMEAMGYLPIGNNFPVFIEKSTKFEYALARKEKKNGHGYKGFKFYYSPNISLEEDLMRRDLTINAIAKNDAGQIIDPFNGVADLRKRLLRHVSDAFIEDPIRVLRVARFAARFRFTVAEETKRLMRKMSKSGELNHLVPERVWKELSTGLMEKYPSQLIEVLSETNSLSYILPKSKELNFIDLQKLKAALDYAAARRLSLECRVAIFARSLISETTKYETITKKDINLVFEKICLTRKCSDFSFLTLRSLFFLAKDIMVSKEKILSFFLVTDAIRKPERFERILNACLTISLFHDKTPILPEISKRLLRILLAVRSIKVGHLFDKTLPTTDILRMVDNLRLEQIKRYL